ncbi:MAG: RDD family protein [Gammaproteobacteria bacterium]|nr:RDD family protein [Gammaproteobacteria bacterium]
MPAEPPPAALPIAPLWKRLAALFYDSLLLFALLMVAVSVAFALKGGRVAGDNLFFRLYLLSISGLFFCGFWVAAGQTLGMKTWYLRVQRRDGRPLGWWQALGRFLLAVPSVGLAGIGLWWMLLDREGLALHDRLSGSVVVMVQKP